MTSFLHLTPRRIATLAAGLLSALTLALPVAEQAHALGSAEVFPNFYRASNIAIGAWSNYLGHCSTMTVYAYDSVEEPDYADAYAFAPLRGCDVYFNSDQRKNYSWAWFCSVMVHEMGHSAGMNHIRDRGDIMHATNEVYWRKCLTGKKARKMRRNGHIIDKSIESWVYSAKTAAASSSHDDHGEVTRRELASAIRSGAIEVDRLASVPVP